MNINALPKTFACVFGARVSKQLGAPGRTISQKERKVKQYKIFVDFF
jgi:hypothetical protein